MMDANHNLSLQTATGLVTSRVLDGFDDPAADRATWARLLAAGPTDAVNLTYEWQRLWWESFGHGRLMLTAAERNGEIIAIAPLFEDGGMIFNICPEDCLNFVGDVVEPGVLDALLCPAIAQTKDFVGLKFYFIPDRSQTGALLMEAGPRLGLLCFEEDEIPCPYLNLEKEPAKALAATRKKSLVRHENYFRREGDLRIRHMRCAEEIAPHLDAFFDQHIRRRATTADASLFEDPVQRAYYQRLTRDIGPTGWLRFTRIDWNDQPIAFHYGLCYRGRYLYGIPSFEVELSDKSPGEVLLRQLILAAIEEGAKTFDFGIGDESYKYRFATDVEQLRTWAMYPAKATAGTALGEPVAP